MKLITAVIRPEKVDEVLDVLERNGFPGVTITEVHGRGEQGGLTLQYRAGKMRIRTLPKIKLEIAVTDEESELVINLIKEHARTGNAGDGRIFVIQLEKTIRVRTDEVFCG